MSGNRRSSQSELSHRAPLRLLDGKETVLLISPQPWSGFKVSKHHYAMELSELGNRVVFLEPPGTSTARGRIEVDALPHQLRSIEVVRYNTWFPYNIKFHSRPLYDLAMKIQAQRILQRVGKQPTVVWDFDESYQFSNLDWFRAGIKIFHPVDQVSPGRDDTKNADVIVSVAPSIAARFHNRPVPQLIVPHGLCSDYESYARARLESLAESDATIDRPDGRIRVGYAGNLLSRALDRPTFLTLVRNHPSVDFELFGPYESKETHPQPILDWVHQLRSMANVRCHGLVPPSRIIESAPKIDMWLVCYDAGLDVNGCTNSHKILEYLATGSPVISNRISAYVDTDLISMPSTIDNHELPSIFAEALGNRQHWHPARATRRIEFALEHSYRHHLRKIESFVNNHTRKRS